MFQQILVPLDGSLRAEHALPIAARIARQASSSVHLVRVIDSPINYSNGLAPMPQPIEPMIEADIASASEYLAAVVTRMPADIKTTTEVLFGIPAQRIMAAAAEHAADLIVLCSHGRTGFVRWTLGSVAHTLAHESLVPTLILQEGESALRLPDADATWPLCVFVPLDGSQLAEAALVPAAHLVTALSAPAQGALHLAQIVKIFPKTAEEGFVSELNEEAMERAKHYLLQTSERLQETVPGLSITWSATCENDVASALTSLAEQEGKGREVGGKDGCDLIAISTHGRHGLERWVMGSVTERVLSVTSLPMLIVRPQKKDEGETK